jgi:hypothetical protein
MILWDANTRRKNDKKKTKKKLLQIQQVEQREQDTRNILNALHEKMDEDDMFKSVKVPWDVDYEYVPFGFKTDSETPEENFKTMNDIFYDLFSWKRISRKLYLIKRKGDKASTKVIKKLKKKTEEDKELEIFISNLKDEEDQIRKRIRSNSSSGKLTKEMENKFVKMEIKKRASEFKNIQNVESKRKSEHGEFTFSSANFEEEKTLEKKKSVRKLLSTMKNMVATNDMTPEEIQKKQLNDKKKELLKASSVGIVKKKLNDSSKALEIDIEELMKEENIEIKKDSDQ